MILIANGSGYLFKPTNAVNTEPDILQRLPTILRLFISDIGILSNTHMKLDEGASFVFVSEYNQ